MDIINNMPNQTPSSQWEYFVVGTKLIISRWTALRMAIEGGWGGGDLKRKEEILFEEILNYFKYQKNVYVDDLIVNIEDYIESEFNLVCEDGSVEEISNVLLALAEDCKNGKFDQVKKLMEAQPVGAINVKECKRDANTINESMDTSEASSESTLAQEKDTQPQVDDDGFTTVPRRSSRRRAQPKMYDPEAQFPGAQ